MADPVTSGGTPSDALELALSVVPRSSDSTAAWLAFSGAMAVALIAAGTAQWRLHKQLSHDRELRDLDEVRRLLDDCAIAAALASQALIKLSTRALSARTWPRDSLVRSWWDRRRRDRNSGAVDQGQSISLSEADAAFWPLLEPTFGLYQRMVLRMGEADPVVRSFLRVQEQLTTGPTAVKSAVRETAAESAERVEKIDRVLNEARAAHFDFLKASRGRAGVKLN